jgi:hypothetical protein
MLKLASLEGLVLEAVLDEQAAGCNACSSGWARLTVQASWCSMKLSTLKRQERDWLKVIVKFN